MDRIKKFVIFAACAAALAAFWALYPAPRSAMYLAVSAAGFIALSLVYAAFGLRISRLLGIREEGVLKYSVAAALSLLTAGTIIFGAGFAGLYNTWFFISLAVAMAVFSYRELSALCNTVFGALKSRIYSGSGGNDVLYISAAAVIVLYLFLLALLPPVYYDTLIYHLAVPAQYMAEGRAINMPENIYSYFPCLMSMNYMMFMGSAGQLGPTLMQFSLAMLAAFSAKELAERLGGSGKWALLLMLTFPLFMLNSARVTVEIPLVFCAAGLLLLFEKHREDLGFGHALSAAAFLAVMTATKYTGVVAYAFASFYIIYLCFRKKAGLAAAITVVLAPLLFFLPYAIRNYIWTGDPVYPFMAQYFSVPEPLKQSAVAYVSHVNGFALKHDLLNFFLAPFYLVFKPSIFGGDVLSPLVIMAIASLFVIDLKKAAAPCLFAAFYYTIWFFTGEVLRFLLPLCMVLIVVTAIAARAFDKRYIIWILGPLVVLQFLSSAFLLEKYQSPLSLLVDSRDEYLSKRVTYYDAAKAVSALPKEDIRAVLYLGEARTMFSGRRIIANTVFNKDFILKDFNTSGEAASLKLLKDNNVGYIMINFDELDRLKDGGFEGVYSVVQTLKFRNFMDKNFTEIYSVGKAKIFRIN